MVTFRLEEEVFQALRDKLGTQGMTTSEFYQSQSHAFVRTSKSKEA